LESWSKKAVSELEEMVLPGQAKGSMEGHIRELEAWRATSGNCGSSRRSYRGSTRSLSGWPGLNGAGPSPLP